MPIGEEAEAFIEQLGKNRALIIGNDAVADARKHDAVAVSRDAFCGEQRCSNETERNDARQITIHVGLVDDVADQVGAEGGATGSHSHHDERNNIFAPMRQALFGEQSPDQGKGAVALVIGRLQTMIVHLPSVGLK